MATKKTSPKKGTPGVNTGSKTRSAIRGALAKGCSIKSIASSSNRSQSVISAIKIGTIKNPPSNVASAIQKGCKKAVASKRK